MILAQADSRNLTAAISAYMEPQHTGVLFIITQQVQPALSMVAMHSQHA